MTFSISSRIGKCLLESGKPFSTKFVPIMKNCFILYIAPLEKHVSVTQQKYSLCQERLVFCQFQMDFIIFVGQTVSGTLQDIIRHVYISLEVYTHFSHTTVYCPFSARRTLLWDQSFQCLVTVEIQLSLV